MGVSVPHSIGDPEEGGFKGVKIGFNNNDLGPGESPNMFNYFANDSGLTKRLGYLRDNQTELVSSTGLTGLFRFFDGTNYHTFAKCGTRVFDVSTLGGSTYVLISVTEAGDTANQLSNWSITGAGNSNTNGGILYWSLTNSGTTRTVNLYKDSAGSNLVATGSRTGDGSITFSASGGSGIGGSVSVAYTTNDTDTANNTLTFAVLNAADELQFTSWFSRYFFTDGTNVYSGTTGAATAISWLNESGSAIAGAKPAGKSILIHGQRMWLTRDANHPTYVYFSQIDSYNKFNTNGGSDTIAWVACDRDDGQAITGMVEYGDKLFVTKTRKSYFITGYPTDVDQGTLNVSKAYDCGAYDQKTIINCADGFIRWFGPGGVWQYIDNVGQPQHISINIDNELNKIATTDLTKCSAEFISGRYYVLWYYYNSEYRGQAYDTQRQQWYPMRGWNISCLCKFEDDSLHGGWATGGYSTHLFTGYSDNGDDISCFYQSRQEGIVGYEQVLDSAKAFNVRAGGLTTIRWGSDPDSPANGSFSVNYTGEGTRLDEFMLDTDILVNISDIEETSASPSSGRLNSQRFQRIFFEISETGSAIHSFDYLIYKSYVNRKLK